MELIDKDALVAEIENLENTYKKCPTRNSYEEGLKDGRLIGYKDALYKINTLEVKEVDLEKEIQDHLRECLNIKFPTTNVKIITSDVEYTARKFFELGLKAQKGE